MRLKEYIDGLFYLFMGADEKGTEKHKESSAKEKIVIVLLFFLIFIVGYFLAN